MQHFQSFLEHVRPFLWDFCLYFEINEYLLQMVILEYEPFFDFNKVKPHTKKKKKKGVDFPPNLLGSLPWLMRLHNMKMQPRNCWLHAGLPQGQNTDRQNKKKIVKAQDLMTRPI